MDIDQSKLEALRDIREYIAEIKRSLQRNSTRLEMMLSVLDKYGTHVVSPNPSLQSTDDDLTAPISKSTIPLVAKNVDGDYEIAQEEGSFLMASSNSPALPPNQIQFIGNINICEVLMNSKIYTFNNGIRSVSRICPTTGSSTMGKILLTDGLFDAAVRVSLVDDCNLDRVMSKDYVNNDYALAGNIIAFKGGTCNLHVSQFWDSLFSARVLVFTIAVRSVTTMEVSCVRSCWDRPTSQYSVSHFVCVRLISCCSPFTVLISNILRLIVNALHEFTQHKNHKTGLVCLLVDMKTCYTGPAAAMDSPELLSSIDKKGFCHHVYEKYQANSHHGYPVILMETNNHMVQFLIATNCSAHTAFDADILTCYCNNRRSRKCIIRSAGVTDVFLGFHNVLRLFVYNPNLTGPASAKWFRGMPLLFCQLVMVYPTYLSRICGIIVQGIIWVISDLTLDSPIFVEDIRMLLHNGCDGCGLDSYEFASGDASGDSVVIKWSWSNLDSDRIDISVTVSVQWFRPILVPNLGEQIVYTSSLFDEAVHFSPNDPHVSDDITDLLNMGIELFDPGIDCFVPGSMPGREKGYSQQYCWVQLSKSNWLVDSAAVQEALPSFSLNTPLSPSAVSVGGSSGKSGPILLFLLLSREHDPHLQDEVATFVQLSIIRMDRMSTLSLSVIIYIMVWLKECIAQVDLQAVLRDATNIGPLSITIDLGGEAMQHFNYGGETKYLVSEVVVAGLRCSDAARGQVTKYSEVLPSLQSICKETRHHLAWDYVCYYSLLQSTGSVRSALELRQGCEYGLIGTRWSVGNGFTLYSLYKQFLSKVLYSRLVALTQVETVHCALSSAGGTATQTLGEIALALWRHFLVATAENCRYFVNGNSIAEPSSNGLHFTWSTMTGCAGSHLLSLPVTFVVSRGTNMMLQQLVLEYDYRQVINQQKWEALLVSISTWLEWIWHIAGMDFALLNLGVANLRYTKTAVRSITWFHSGGLPAPCRSQDDVMSAISTSLLEVRILCQMSCSPLSQDVEYFIFMVWPSFGDSQEGSIPGFSGTVSRMVLFTDYFVWFALHTLYFQLIQAHFSQLWYTTGCIGMGVFMKTSFESIPLASAKAWSLGSALCTSSNTQGEGLLRPINKVLQFDP
ncbi:hypothetical protein ACHQM5_011582 [Ranunculus cassubicifolius]